MGLKIMMAVCFLPCLFLMYGILYLEGKQKGNILLGVTLWPKGAKDETVGRIKRQFKREMNGLLLLSLVLFACTCIPSRESLVVSTQMLWLIFVIVIFFFPLAKGNSRMKALKRERADGTEQTAGKVYIDGKAAGEPKEKPFLKLSLAGAACGLIPMIAEPFLAGNSFYGWWTELLLAVMFLASLICFWIQYKFWYLRTDVVSFRSDVNNELARVRQYQWSRFWSIMIWCNTLVTLAMWYGMHKPKEGFYAIFPVVILYMAVVAVTAFLTEHNVRKVYGKYAAVADLQGEEDDNWIYGIFYYNKNDDRFMVNKRVGIGTTVNMAKTSAKVFCTVTLAGTLGLLIWAAAFILLEDFAPISLRTEEQVVISSQYKEEYRIPVAEIESLKLVEELPSMSKRVGSAMDTVLKGSFLDEDYVSCKVCVRRKEPPFVKIVSTDGMVYYLNDEEGKVTEQVFLELKKELE